MMKFGRMSWNWIIFQSLIFLLSFAAPVAYAGGPLVVKTDGTPLKWSTTNPVPFSPDGGNLGLWDNATAVTNVLEAFNDWGPDISTSALTFSNAGPIPGDGNVNTVAEFNALDGNCADGISPVIFDADGSLFSALGLPTNIIAFAGPECYIPATGTITQSFAAFNGKWFDGNSANGELTLSEFKGVLVHEFGHWLNLDHSQVNGQYFLGDSDPGFSTFGPPPLSSVEVMFPFAIGGATTPRKDDVAAISRLYPTGGFGTTTGTITGTIFLPNGVTPFQGADVIARNISDPYNDAISNVSGSPYASPSSVGSYELPGLTDGASYSVEIVNVNSQFTGGSGVGPLDPPQQIPGPEEFYNGANESATNPPDDVTVYTPIVSTGGVLTAGINILINGASADLAISKADSPDPVAVSQNLTYTLTVINNGPNTATGVTVTDTIPASTTFASASSGQGSCSQANGVVTCTLGSIGIGATATATIVVVPTTTGTISNTASVFSNENDPNTGNNSSTATTTVNPPSADLSITKTDSPDPVAVGTNLTYTIAVRNNGPSTATGVTLTDTLPSGLTYVSSTPTQGSCSQASGTVTCNLGNISNGSTATITIVVTPTATGTISNTASVSSSVSDPNTANNNATATTNVIYPLRLLNISTRALVQTGANVEIAGFIIGGNVPKQVLIRGRGPSMSGAPFNYSGTLANPFLQIYSFASSSIIAQNDNWQTTDPLCSTSGYTCGTPAQITATGKDPCVPNPGQTTAPPGCTQESAILITLPPGNYGALLSGVNGGTGVGLAEVFDTDGSTLPKLTNISTRAFVGTNTNVLIGGFIIGAGTGNKTILIRARGPSMSGAPFNFSGTLANPFVQVYSFATQSYIAQNDDWQTTDPLCSTSGYTCGTPADIMATGLDPCQPNPGQTTAPPGCTQESAILIHLPPGNYGAIVSGISGGTGIGLVEVFELAQ